MEKVTLNSKRRNNQKKAVKSEEQVDVLYQRLGDRWFAFSVVNEEIFFGEVPADVIETEVTGAETTDSSAAKNRAA